MIETRWWWVRHAPVPDGGRIYGQKDLPCDCSDAAVFEAVAATLPHEAVWVTSHLQRTTQTASAIIKASAGRHAPVEMPAFETFAEQHLGDWQGMDRAEFRRMTGMGTTSFWFNAAHEKAPNGESFNDLVARVTSTIEDLTKSHRGKHIVAVTHGGTIRVAVALALGLGPEAALSFSMENCSLTRLDHLRPGDGPGVWRVVCVNHRPWTRAPHHAQSTNAPGGIDRG